MLSDLLKWGGKRLEPTQAGAPRSVSAAGEEPVVPTKALRKFLAALTAQPSPVLLDLGPVVGTNVKFFGEQLGCKIFIEDIFADLDRHTKAGTLDALPGVFDTRFPQADASVDGILCWDLFDYLDKASAQALAAQLIRMLRPGGALLGFFGTAAKTDAPPYTKYVIVDDVNLRHRLHPGVGGVKRVLQNRDIIRLFEGLAVSDSFLLQNNIREILFRSR